MSGFRINVYFYSCYNPASRACRSALIEAVSAGNAREKVRERFPNCKYLTVHRVPELAAEFVPKYADYIIVQRSAPRAARD